MFLVKKGQKLRTLGQKVVHALASFVLNSHSSYSEGYHSSSDDDRKLTSREIVKSTSLERNINCRITEAEEQARRTRSLERNHRHLVTIDSTCR